MAKILWNTFPVRGLLTKSKLNQYRPEIETLIANSSTQKFITRRYGTTEANLHNWLKKTVLHEIRSKSYETFYFNLLTGLFARNLKKIEKFAVGNIKLRKRSFPRL